MDITTVDFHGPRLRDRVCGIQTEWHKYVLIYFSKAVAETTVSDCNNKIIVYLGLPGPDGDTGIMGITGRTGQKGAKGLSGAQGSVGYQGPDGIYGPPGSTGSAGSTGIIGFQGTYPRYYPILC